MHAQVHRHVEQHHFPLGFAVQYQAPDLYFELADDLHLSSLQNMNGMWDCMQAEKSMKLAGSSRGATAALLALQSCHVDRV